MRRGEENEEEGESSSSMCEEGSTGGDDSDDEDGSTTTTYYSMRSTLEAPPPPEPGVPWWFSSRLALSILAFFGCMSMASQRVSMEVAIVCMVNKTLLADDLSTTDLPEVNTTGIPKTALDLVEEECGKRPRVFPENLTLHATWEGTYEWPAVKQDLVFALYFWGFLLSQVPSGWMATRFGGKWVIGGMTMLGSICTGLVPLATRSHYFTLVITRFLGGFGAGVMFPAMHAVWGRWSPPEERSRLASIGFTGAMLGHTVTYPLSATLCEYGLDGGWPSLFYLLGVLGLMWSVFWMLFANSSPTEHGRISKEEKEYVLETLSGEALLNGEKYDDTPWISFFGSMPFAVLVVNNFTCEWGMYNFTISVPYFMKKFLKYNIEMDPAIHAFPYIGLGFLIFMTGIWSDKLRLRGVIKTSIVRKVFQSIGTFIPATLLVGLGFLGCHQAAGAVSILVLSMTFAAFQYNGYIMNHLDIAPKHAGILLGVSNSVGLLAYVLAPLLQNYIITEDTREQWQTWLLITASFYIFGTLCFILGGEGKLQEWAECDEYGKDDSSTSSSSHSPPPPLQGQTIIALPLRSKSIALPLTAKRKGDEPTKVVVMRQPSQGVVSPKTTPQRLSAPDLPSELHRQSSAKGVKKSSAPDVSKPTLAPGTRTVRKRSDVSDESEGSSSRSANVRRSMGDSTNPTGRPLSRHDAKVPTNLDTLSESIV